MEKIELINLTLDEIRRAAQMIEGVRVQALWSNHISPDIVKDKIATDCEEQLERTRLVLREVLEDIEEFQNGQDMLLGVDCALAKVSLDLIYERKNEDDFGDE